MDVAHAHIVQKMVVAFHETVSYYLQEKEYCKQEGKRLSHERERKRERETIPRSCFFHVHCLSIALARSLKKADTYEKFAKVEAEREIESESNL